MSLVIFVIEHCVSNPLITALIGRMNLLMSGGASSLRVGLLGGDRGARCGNDPDAIVDAKL